MSAPIILTPSQCKITTRAYALALRTLRSIRARSSAGESSASIARSLNLNPATVSCVLSGKTWGHVR